MTHPKIHDDQPKPSFISESADNVMLTEIELFAYELFGANYLTYALFDAKLYNSQSVDGEQQDEMHPRGPGQRGSVATLFLKLYNPK